MGLEIKQLDRGCSCLVFQLTSNPISYLRTHVLTEVGMLSIC